MLPKTMSADYKRKGNQVDESEMERSLSLEDYPVILYCHGNSYDRDFVERAKMKDVGASTFVVVVMLIFLAFCTYILNHSNRLSFRIVRLPLALQAIKYNVTTDEKTTEYTRLKVKRNT